MSNASRSHINAKWFVVPVRLWIFKYITFESTISLVLGVGGVGVIGYHLEAPGGHVHAR